jgi:putative transposase
LYFNEKYERSGSLFQGPYKATHIATNEQLLHVSAYTNLNDKVHGDLNKKWLSILPFSSFEEYKHPNGLNGICDTSIILSQFNSPEAYCQYAESVLKDIIKRKEREKSLPKLLID